jgi:Tol biopolymer transport system component
VVKSEPFWDEVPSKVRRLLKRCLEKDAKKRLRDIGDAPFLLDDVTPESNYAPSRSAPRARLGVTLAALAAVLFVALAIVSFIHFRQALPEAPVIRSSILPPDEASAFVLDGNAGGSAISPNGRMLAFVADVNGKAMLFVRPLDSSLARMLPGSEGASRPFWSPDSSNIAFATAGKLKRVGVAEAAPRDICDLSSPMRGATWNREGVIVLASQTGGGLARVLASGGTPENITASDQAGGERSHYWPQFLPDGRHFLYVARNLQVDKGVVYAGSLDDKHGGGKRIRLADSVYGAVYAPIAAGSRTGYLLVMQGGNLMAQAFDPTTLKLSGEPELMAQDVGVYEGNGYMDVSASSTGVLAYGTVRQSLRRLVWFDRDGKKSEPVSDPGFWVGPRISSNGRSVAAGRLEGSGADVWLIDLARGTHQKFTFTGNVVTSPVWSPDGREIVYGVMGKGLFRKAVDGAGEPAALPSNTTPSVAADWSDDGKFLVYGTRAEKPGTGELSAIPFKPGGSAGKPVSYLKAPSSILVGSLRFSPGLSGPRRIAYQSDESGTLQVYVRNFPDARGQTQVSTDGGQRPVWRRDGKELFYIGAGNKLMRVSVTTTGGGFTPGKPEPLFYAPMGFGDFDISPDGRRFLFSAPDAQNPPNHRLDPITLVQNWAAGLRK